MLYNKQRTCSMGKHDTDGIYKLQGTKNRLLALKMGVEPNIMSVNSYRTEYSVKLYSSQRLKVIRDLLAQDFGENRSI